MTIADEFEALLGSAGVVTGDRLASFNREERGRFEGRASLALMPATVDEVQAAVRLCAAKRIPIVPQGGNTGLVGGAVAGDEALILSTRRLNRIRKVDAENFSITAEAGATIAEIRAAADTAGCLFPLNYASAASATIGGAVNTNAGGVQALRFGVTRDLVLGVEAVLADGTLFNALRPLRKDNSGYHLKQLLIGSEGTLGIVTAVSVKLVPAFRHTVTAWLGVDSVASALQLLALARRVSGDTITSFELVNPMCLQLIRRHFPELQIPDVSGCFHILAEFATAADTPLEDMVLRLFDEAGIADGALARNERDRQAMWRIRETIPAAQTREGASLKHDISVPVSAIPAFISQADALVANLVPGVRPVSFGHLGDGNIHYNLTVPEGMDNVDFLARQDEVADAVHVVALSLDGSISAEHGIGITKRAALAATTPPQTLALMRAVKTAFDPHNLMNPGKIIG